MTLLSDESELASMKGALTESNGEQLWSERKQSNARALKCAQNEGKNGGGLSDETRPNTSARPVI